MEKIRFDELMRAFSLVMPLRDRSEGDNSQRHLDVLNAALPKLLRLARAAHKLDSDGFKGDEWHEALSAFDFTD